MRVVEDRPWPLERVVSGGQSGCDRAGLEVARALGIPTGGTAPRGYRTEFGPDLDLRDIFGLTESESATYDVRTLANVRSADLTVVFGADTGGTRDTMAYCRVLEKLHLHEPSPEDLRRWIMIHGVRTLNVAGSRHSKNPMIFDMTAIVLAYALLKPGQLPIRVPSNPHEGR